MITTELLSASFRLLTFVSSAYNYTSFSVPFDLLEEFSLKLLSLLRVAFKLQISQSVFIFLEF